MSEYKRLTERKASSVTTHIDDWPTWQVMHLALSRLADYEDIGSPEELAELAKAKVEGRLVILPTKSEEIIRIVEFALKIKLYDWQKAYITGASDYVMPGRVSGKTTVYMIKLCLSEGDPIDLTKREIVERYADGIHGSAYVAWFRDELWRVYDALKRIGGIKLREIIFSKNKARDVYDRR